MITQKILWVSLGRTPWREIKKTLRKTRKNNMWKLLVLPPRPQDLWNMFFFCFPKGFCIFGQKTKKTSRKPKKNKKKTIFGNSWWDPPHPKTSGILFLFFCFFLFSRCFFLLCANPPHPQDLWNIGFLVFFFSMLLLVCANPPHPQDL